MEMGSYMYEMLNNAEDQSLKETAEERGATYTEEWNKGNVTITISYENPDPETINANSEVQGDYIIYRDDLMDQAEDVTNSDYDMDMEELENQIKKHYYLEMPGDIVESNADVVNGNKAEWHMIESEDSRPVYAKSEVSSNPLPALVH